jgi:hypothetical protein
MDRHKNRESFERFYLTKVALGEGCGCAEHATRIRELEAYFQDRALRAKASAARSAFLLLPLKGHFRRQAEGRNSRRRAVALSAAYPTNANSIVA